MLWFFTEKNRPTSSDMFEVEANLRFLDRPFTKTSTSLRNYVKGSSDREYRLGRPTAYPKPASQPDVRRIVEAADGRQPMRDLLKKCGIDCDDHDAVTNIRTGTTTSLNPHLRAL